MTEPALLVPEGHEPHAHALREGIGRTDRGTGTLPDLRRGRRAYSRRFVRTPSNRETLSAERALLSGELRSLQAASSNPARVNSSTGSPSRAWDPLRG